MPRLWLLALLPLLSSAATTALFSPFPSDSLTVADSTGKNGIRINLPVPSCTAQPTSCQETQLLNQLDGFSVRARAAVQFSGPVDLSTIAGGIFFVALDELTQEEKGIHTFGQQIPLDQVVFDPATNTVYGKPYSALDQHRHYALIVTNTVKDMSGSPVVPDPAFESCLQSSDAYCAAMAAELSKLTFAVIQTSPGQPAPPLVAASLFTTMSATYWLEQARTIVANTPPAPALATPQSAFPIATLATLTLHEQTGDNPTRFSDLTLPLPAALLTGINRLVIGTYQSPNFLEANQTIPGGPPLALYNPADGVAQSNTIYYNALVPSSPKPAAGYPVVIFGHGLGDSRFGGPTAVASTLAQAGFAVIAINAVGHGFGPLGTVTFTDTSNNSVTLPSGGRGVDLNSDGSIGSDEGCILIAPIAYGTRDCFRQTVVDLMQLTHTIQLGLDLDGDGAPDLDASHIYYAGQSLGGMYGAIFTAVEPAVRAAVLNVGGASATDVARWSPAYHTLSVEALGTRVPSLLNLHGGYDEDYVLPEQPPHITTFPGAMAIQNVFENLEWLSMQGDPMAFAPHLSVSPLPTTTARSVLFQFARADRTMPNPATSGLIRAAGGLANTWIYRHDLARARFPDLPLDPHPFLVLFVSLNGSAIQLPGLDGLSISLDAQGQLAGFLAADGASIPNPNSLSQILFGFPVFQTVTSLPEDFGYAGKREPGAFPVLRRVE